MSPQREIESPCVAVCQVDRARGICVGCRRTLQEITGWVDLSPEERRRIMDQLPTRPLPAVTLPR